MCTYTVYVYTIQLSSQSVVQFRKSRGRERRKEKDDRRKRGSARGTKRGGERRESHEKGGLTVIRALMTLPRSVG